MGRHSRNKQGHSKLKSIDPYAKNCSWGKDAGLKDQKKNTPASDTEGLSSSQRQFLKKIGKTNGKDQSIHSCIFLTFLPELSKKPKKTQEDPSSKKRKRTDEPTNTKAGKRQKVHLFSCPFFLRCFLPFFLVHQKKL